MLRFTFQMVRKHIKPLILIVSFITFIWLIVDTAHRPEFVRHASKHSFRFGNNANEPQDHWSERTLEQFLELLKFESKVYADESKNQFNPAECPREKTLLFTAFTGNSLVENLWHYLSLVAIQGSVDSTEHQTIVMLTNGTAVELRTIFETVPYTLFNLKMFWCISNPPSNVKFLNGDTNIEIGDDSLQLFILNNEAKPRLEEILNVPWEERGSIFKFRAEALNTVITTFNGIRLFSKLFGDEEDVMNLQFVGMHIREEDDLSYEYYERAMIFLRKIHDTGLLMFIAICENPESTICSTLNEQSERIKVIPQHNEPDLDFALLTFCNHSILSNELDIFPSLLRGVGNVVVYGKQNERTETAIEIANIKESWYTIV